MKVGLGQAQEQAIHAPLVEPPSVPHNSIKAPALTLLSTAWNQDLDAPGANAHKDTEPRFRSLRLIVLG